MKKIALSLILGLSLYASGIHQAKVQETLNSGGYTYMKVKDGKNSYWIAMTKRDVKVGDTVKFNEQIWMKNFHSKTLNRTFDNILFAADTTPRVEQKKVQKVQKVQPNIMTSKYKTKDSVTIAELFKHRDAYVGKKVTVHAIVTKVSEAIMKLNWVHLEDGSRFMNMNDLVFTSTQTPPKVGEVVYATGTVVKDKDFGYGYFYPLIIQEATFRK